MKTLCCIALALATAACGSDDGEAPTEPVVGPDGELIFTRTPNAGIPDLTNLTDVMLIDEAGFVGELEVDLDIAHPRVFELIVSLEHVESGVRFDLVRSPLSVSDDIDVRLADDAPVDIQDDVRFEEEDGPAYDLAEYRPFEPLSFMIGEPLAGHWRLSVVDTRTDEQGTLRSWSLRVRAADTPPPAAVALARPRSLPRRITAGITQDQIVRYRQLSGAGAVSVSVDGGAGVSGSFVVVDNGSPIKTGVVSFAGSELGPATLAFTASDGDVADVVEAPTEFVDINANGLSLVAHLSPAQLGYPGFEGNDCWGWTDPDSGTEYALMGLEGGLAFVDLTDAANPVVLGTLDTHTKPSAWRDVKVYDDYAFIVSEADGHGMQIFDLTQLRGLDGGQPVKLAETAHFGGFGSAHNIAIDEVNGFAYVVGAVEDGFADQCSGGLYMVNIRTPTQPTFAGCFSGGDPAVPQPGDTYPKSAYTHDVQCVVYDGPDTRYSQRQLCFSSDDMYDESGLTFLGIADTTDKSNVRQVARLGYPDFGFAHQGWLSEDHRYFFLNDEFDELTLGSLTRTVVFDLENLEEPKVLGVFENPSFAIGHNSYVVGDSIYMANYTSGLRLVNLNPDEAGVIAIAGMQEVAFFDTYPDDDPANGGQGAPSFSGAWSTYPFFASGNILISDIDRGLFVVR